MNIYNNIIMQLVRIIAHIKYTIRKPIPIKQLIDLEQNSFDVVHFISGAVFRPGYIKFMTQNFQNYKHLFITTGSNAPTTFESMDNVIVFDNFSTAVINKHVLQICRASCGIIFSGVFNKVAIMLAPSWLISKSFFQLWGADFYCYREPWHGIKTKYLHDWFIKQCDEARGLVFLIHGEEDVFRRILPVKNERVYIAPVPAISDVSILCCSFSKKIQSIRITIGNSATKENHHLDVFDKIKRLSSENLEIYCPLSYGDASYKEKIKSYGIELFGNKFHALEEFMNFNDYIQYLADCDVGIFNNDRQQALGNIYFLLALGKKVYLNRDTSMWTFFNSIDCTVYDIDFISKQTLGEIIDFPPNVAKKNKQIISRYISNQYAIDQWDKIFRVSRDKTVE